MLETGMFQRSHLGISPILGALGFLHKQLEVLSCHKLAETEYLFNVLQITTTFTGSRLFITPIKYW